MKHLLLSFFIIAIALTSHAQIAIGINAGIATSSKINYAANKSMQLLSGRILYTTNHFQGGLAVTYNMLNDAAYTSILDIGLIANGRIPLSNNYENLGGYITAGGGIGYGTADFGKGMSLGLQVAYGYQFNPHFALHVEIAPRYYNLTENQDIFAGKWAGFMNTTIDRFFVLPLSLGMVFKF